MKRSLALFAPALALALAVAGRSQAGPIPTSGPSVTVVWSNSPTDISASQGGGVFFLPESQHPIINQETQIAAASVILSTAASPTNPDVIAAPASGTNYAVSVDLTHQYKDSHGVMQTADATITFNSLITGSMNGSFTDAHGNTVAGAAELNNTIHDIFYNGVDHLVTAGTANPFATVTLGDATVKVQYLSFAPVLPNEHNPGAISFDITPAWGSGGVIGGGGSAPEPSSIILGCLGLSCIGGVALRARRRAAAGALKAVAV